ncbi:MAG TPA: hypothetical protein VIX81_07895 [Gammaproteobacteria bacterium]
MKVRYLCLSALAALAFSAGAAAQQAPLCATEVARLQNSLDSDVNMKEEIEKQVEAHLDQAENLCNAGQAEQALDEVAKGFKLLKDNPA